MGRDILVTGGAGYIGSHAVLALKDAGWQPVVLDNLVTGMRDLVPADVPFYKADIADAHALAQIGADHDIAGIMHFAGSVVVPESVADPLKYYRNNTACTAALLAHAIAQDWGPVLFSSTAAVYGHGNSTRPIREDDATAPINPYGRSKLMIEWMLEDCAAAHGLRYAALRYFNVAGADPAGRTGQATPEATHLIKIATRAALGLTGPMTIYGTDYHTPDGTCMRDYIHVTDLVDAHLTALSALLDGAPSSVCNLGYGRGTSVREVVDAVGRLHGAPVPYTNSNRRPGDPASLIADASRFKRHYGWQPKHDDLDEIIRSALAWEAKWNKLDAAS